MQVNPCTCVATPSTCVRGAGCPGSMEVAPPCSDLGTCWMNIAVFILDLGGSPRLMSINSPWTSVQEKQNHLRGFFYFKNFFILKIVVLPKPVNWIHWFVFISFLIQLLIADFCSFVRFSMAFGRPQTFLFPLLSVFLLLNFLPFASVSSCWYASFCRSLITFRKIP